MRLSALYRPNVLFALAVVLGLALGYADNKIVNEFAHLVSEIFIRLLKLVSLPIIFLSLVTTATRMEDYKEVKFMGIRVLRYTLLTTMIAAAVALTFYIIVDPVRGDETLKLSEAVALDKTSYMNYFLKAIPSNMLRPFVENQVIGVMMIAILLSLSIVSLPKEHKAPLHALFHSLYLMIMKITAWVVKLMPLAVFAFIVLFMRDFKFGPEMQSIGLYLFCVIMANIVQGFVILPALLKLNGISPLRLAKQVSPALSLAFFSKSSSATIPMAIKCATERAHISSKIANFSLPLCVTINMNGCAAFILTTVLFVSMSNGIEWSYVEMLGWVVIATIAAFGNAGVPMGCYFLSSAILAAMNVPLNILGVILPFYAIIDMIETSLNVWSDCCVTAIVEKEVKEALLTQPVYAD
jgi:Na+/H+-dicarboxylate symporter